MRPSRVRFIALLAASLGVTACASGQPEATDQLPSPSVAAVQLLGTPAAPAVAVAGDVATFTWASPQEGVEVLSYRVYLDEEEPLELASEALSHDFTGLEQGRSYYAQVVAVGTAGTSAPAGVTFQTAFPEAPPLERKSAPDTAQAAPGTDGGQSEKQTVQDSRARAEGNGDDEDDDTMQGGGAMPSGGVDTGEAFVEDNDGLVAVGGAAALAGLGLLVLARRRAQA